MAGSSNRKPDADEERRRWVAFALLVAVAGGTLLLGAGLSSSVPLGDDDPPPIDEEPVARLVEAAPSAPLPSFPSPTAMDRLADRAAADLERMASSSREWTNQLAVLCDTASVEELLERVGNSRELRLLPAYVGDQTCFRVCWGSYDSRDQAGADMPADLGREFPDAYPRRKNEVLE